MSDPFTVTVPPPGPVTLTVRRPGPPNRADAVMTAPAKSGSVTSNVQVVEVTPAHTPVQPVKTTRDPAAGAAVRVTCVPTATNSTSELQFVAVTVLPSGATATDPAPVLVGSTTTQNGTGPANSALTDAAPGDTVNEQVVAVPVQLPAQPRNATRSVAPTADSVTTVPAVNVAEQPGAEGAAASQLMPGGEDVTVPLPGATRSANATVTVPVPAVVVVVTPGVDGG